MPKTRRSAIGSGFAVGLVMVGAVLFMASTASAQVYVGVPPPQVGAVDVGVPGAQVLGTQGAPAAPRSVQVLGASSTPRAQVGGSLALTGADILGICALALLSVGVGTLFIRAGRRSPAN
jgi:hypothetical protein